MRSVRPNAIRLAAALCLATLAMPGAQAQNITLFAGSGSLSGPETGVALTTPLNRPAAVAHDALGNTYIAESQGNRIRRVNSFGSLSNWVGTGAAGYLGEGAGISVPVNFPRALVMGPSGDLYFADAGNHRVRKVSSNGLTSLVAGSGTCSLAVSSDGSPATSAGLCAPVALAFDAAGNLYIAEATAHVIRRVSTTGTITTVAGTRNVANFRGDGGAATAAWLNTPTGLTVDAAGNLYIADSNSHRVRRVDTSGVITTYAGTGTAASGGDGGLATLATLNRPLAVLAVPGHLLISEGDGQKVRRVSQFPGSSTTITTVAGTGATGYSGDGGPATSAALGYPIGLSRDAFGQVYLAEFDNARVRRFLGPPDAAVITGLSPSANAVQVFFSAPFAFQQGVSQFVAQCSTPGGPGGIGFGSGSAIFVPNLGLGYSYTCIVTTQAAGGAVVSNPAGPVLVPLANSASLSAPASVVLNDPVTIQATVNGNAPVGGQVTFLADGVPINGCQSVSVTAQTPIQGLASCTTSSLAVGTHQLAASWGGNGGAAPNAGASTQPRSIAVALLPQTIVFPNPTDQPSNAAPFTVSATGGGSGNPVAFSSLTNKVCFTSGANGSTVTLTGLTGDCTIQATQGGNATFAAATPVSRSFIVEPSVAGVPILSTVAGTGVAGSGASGVAAASTPNTRPVGVARDAFGNVYVAEFNAGAIRRIDANGLVTDFASGLGGLIWGIATDAAGNVYTATGSANRVHKITPAGVASVFAGTGAPGFSGDGGPATAAQLWEPRGVAVDAAGNVYISDANNNRVRRVAPDGTISTVAGSGDFRFAGDGGPATAAGVNTPEALAVDAAGTLYFGEINSSRIRKVSPAGIISTIAGNGSRGTSPDGSVALGNSIDTPRGLALDAAGNVFVALMGEHRIRRITPAGLIYTVAGSGAAADGATGVPAVGTAINFPSHVAVDADGSVIFTEEGGNKTRRVSFPAPTAPGAPVITAVTVSFDRVELAFAAPNDGYSGILEFTVTCGALSVVVVRPPAVLTGFAPDTAYTCTVTARNAVGNGPPSAPTASVTPKPSAAAFTSAPAPNVSALQAYSHTLVATGVPPPTYAVSAGALPPGLVLDTATGVLSGAATTGGRYQGTFSASNGAGPAATQAFDITVFKILQEAFVEEEIAFTVGVSTVVTTYGGESGNPVIVTSLTPAICTATGTNGTIITGLAVGTCRLKADQAGNEAYEPAESFPQDFPVGAATSGALTVSKTGAGTGTVASSPAGIDCGAACAANFALSSVVALTASPAAGSTFVGWSGACTGTGACNVTMDAAKSVTAEFGLAVPANPPRLANISTRMQVLTGNDVLIGGFIIGGSQAKTVVVRARGPSLVPLGVPNALANPVLQLFSGPTQIAANDDWKEAANQAALSASGFAPANDFESAILTTLNPGAYTAIVTGAALGTGVAIIEVFEVDLPAVPLLNISTRGKVLTGGDVMIGGFIIQGDAPQTVVIRARGPSLTAAGVPGALQDPVLQLFAGQAVIASNDDWQASPDAAAIQSSGFAPSDAREAVIRVTLNPGAYTAIVTGKNGTTGVGIIEVFAP